MENSAKKLRLLSQEKSLKFYVDNGGSNVFLKPQTITNQTIRLGVRDAKTGKDSVIYQNDSSEIAGKRIFNSSQPIGSPVIATRAYSNPIIVLDNQSNKQPDDSEPDEQVIGDYVFKGLVAVILATPLGKQETQIWLGLDRKASKLIYSYSYVNSTNPSSNTTSNPLDIGLTHTGIQRKHWVVSLYRKNLGNSTNELIYLTPQGILKTWEVDANNLSYKGWNVWGSEIQNINPVVIYQTTTPTPTPPPSNSVTYIYKGEETSNIKINEFIVGFKKRVVDNSKVEFTDNVNLAGLLCDFDRTTVGKLIYNENKSEVADETYQYPKTSLWCDDKDLVESNITTTHTKHETFANKLKNATEITYRWVCHFTVEGFGINGGMLVGRYLGSIWAGEFNKNQAQETRVNETTKEDIGSINITKNLGLPYSHKIYEYINSDTDIFTDKFYRNSGTVNRITDYQKINYTTIKSETKNSSDIVLNGEAFTIYKTTNSINSTTTTQNRIRQRNTLQTPVTDLLVLNETIITETINTSNAKYYLVSNQDAPTTNQLESLPINSLPSINASVESILPNFTPNQAEQVLKLPVGNYYSSLNVNIDKKIETRIRTINVDIFDSDPNINKTDITLTTQTSPKPANQDIATLFIGRQCCAVTISTQAGKPILKQYYGVIESYTTSASNTLPLPETVPSSSAPGTQTITTTSYIPSYPQTLTITSVNMRLTRIEETSYDHKKSLTSNPNSFQFYTLGSIYDLPVNLDYSPSSSNLPDATINAPIPSHCTLITPDNADMNVNTEVLGRLLISNTTINKTGKLVSFAESYDLVLSAATGIVEFIRQPASKPKESLKSNEEIIENFVDTSKAIIGRKQPINKDILATPAKIVLCNPTTT